MVSLLNVKINSSMVQSAEYYRIAIHWSGGRSGDRMSAKIWKFIEAPSREDISGVESFTTKQFRCFRHVLA